MTNRRHGTNIYISRPTDQRQTLHLQPTIERPPREVIDSTMSSLQNRRVDFPVEFRVIRHSR